MKSIFVGLRRCLTNGRGAGRSLSSRSHGGDAGRGAQRGGVLCGLLRRGRRLLGLVALTHGRVGRHRGRDVQGSRLEGADPEGVDVRRSTYIAVLCFFFRFRVRK